MREQFGRAIGFSIALVILGAAIGCTTAPETKTTLERMSDANRLAADLLAQFAMAGDAADRAVMADTDEASSRFAREAEQATQAVQKDTDTLTPILAALQFSDEVHLLQEFSKRFAEYRALDRKILDLAVENTNLKAQQLSFGPAQKAADAFRDSLKTIAPAAAGDASHVAALVATAVADVREIQVLQAPHIAASDDAVMTSLEKQMGASDADARAALGMLAKLDRPSVAARARSPPPPPWISSWRSTRKSWRCRAATRTFAPLRCRWDRSGCSLRRARRASTHSRMP